MASAWIIQPLVRSRQANLYAQVGYDAKRLRDRVGVTDTRSDRRLDNWTLSLNGDLRDGLPGGGVTSWNLGWTHGCTGFGDATGQWANAKLDSAEKMSVGGPYSVRAYDVGTVSGDTGYSATAELRHELAGGLQAIAFADSARVTINRHPWTASPNAVRLSGAGLGLAWNGSKGWRASLSVATPVGATPVGAAPRLLGPQPVHTRLGRGRQVVPSARPAAATPRPSYRALSGPAKC